MVLKLFFDISISFRFSKISVECTLHSEAPPWSNQLEDLFKLLWSSLEKLNFKTVPDRHKDLQARYAVNKSLCIVFTK